MKRSFLLVFTIICAVLVLTILTIYFINNQESASEPKQFDPERAFQDVQAQLSFGSRIPGSDAHLQAEKYITDELEKAGWKTETQVVTLENHEIRNIIAKRGSGNEWIIVGSHYDSRLVADQDVDPVLSLQPVAGANDGASSTAVLLELARDLPRKMDKQIWLVFFDCEDQGDLPGWKWILGSTAFVDSLESKPDAAVIIDMVGDRNLNIYREEASTQSLVDEIWSSANQLGYEEYFIDSTKYNILDDHLPFIQAGIQAADIIDFDYPYWHTSQDTLNNVSSDSLKIVGEVLLNWLTQER